MAGLLSSALMGPAQRLGAVAVPETAATPMAPGGLLSMFAPQAAQSPLYQAFDQRRNVLMGALLGGVGAESPLERLRGIAQGALKGREADTAYGLELKKDAQSRQAINQTLQLLTQKRPDLVPWVQSGAITPAVAFKTMVSGGDAPANVREWEYFNKLAPEDQSRYLRMKRANPYLNLGTEFAQPDPANPGQIAGTPIPIDNEGKARDTAAGKAQGEAAASYRSMASKLPGLQGVVNELDKIAEEATYTLAGQGRDAVARQFGITTDGALARTKYIAMVDNQILPLLRDTFGAQFTVAEGESLRATLGDPNKSPQEKQAVLKAFIEQKKRDVEALALQSMGQLPGQMPTPQGNATSSGVQWSIEP